MMLKIIFEIFTNIYNKISFKVATYKKHIMHISLYSEKRINNFVLVFIRSCS